MNNCGVLISESVLLSLFNLVLLIFPAFIICTAFMTFTAIHDLFDGLHGVRGLHDGPA